ncbi:MAG: MmcQ/YjbR family DNA-binding protein [Eubacterium sp.]|jgi:predicted DNA-binding protein (MmcQ/YjbR family)|nr:MmcQ/YjbR family DNA-binding protein [Eubacterium sp.]
MDDKSTLPLNYLWLDEYLSLKAGSSKDFKIEWQWHRYLLKDKMFAAICSDKTGGQIVTLKCEPTVASMLREQYPDILPGYYMNKEHWNSVYLEGQVPQSVIKQMVDMSYQLIYKSLGKKLQQEIINPGGSI